MVFTDDGCGGGSLAPLLGDIPILGPVVNEDVGMKGWFHAPERPRAEPAVWRVLPMGMNGSGNWTRTSDLAVNSRLLYRLSYAGSAAEF